MATFQSVPASVTPQSHWHEDGGSQQIQRNGPTILDRSQRPRQHSGTSLIISSVTRPGLPRLAIPPANTSNRLIAGVNQPPKISPGQSSHSSGTQYSDTESSAEYGAYSSSAEVNRFSSENSYQPHNTNMQYPDPESSAQYGIGYAAEVNRSVLMNPRRTSYNTGMQYPGPENSAHYRAYGHDTEVNRPE